MKLLRILAISVVVLALLGLASAQSWTPLQSQPPAAVGPMLQLRDGRILVNESQGPDTGQWFIFSPAANGSYVAGGPFDAVAGGHLQAGYPHLLRFASAAGRQARRHRGRRIQPAASAVWTTLGAVGTVVPFGAVVG